MMLYTVLRKSRLAFVSVLSTLLVGCFGSGVDLPDTVPVTGKVEYNGEAVAGARVTFRHKDGAHPAIGITGPDGTFQLTTFSDGDGAVPGEHTVTVAKNVTAGASPSGGGGAMGDGASMEQSVAEASEDQAAGTLESLLPPKYADPTTSGLKFSVTEDGDNDFPITLTD